MEQAGLTRSERPDETRLALSLGEWVRHARLRLQFSQRELAERAGISRSYLCDIERGRGARPSVEMLDKLALALGMLRTDLLLAAGIIEAPVGESGDSGEHRLLALYRDLGPENRHLIERFARFLRDEEFLYIQRPLLSDSFSESPVHQSGPTLFDLSALESDVSGPVTR